jgi:hypothetical protein
MPAPSRVSKSTIISLPPLGAGGKPLADAAEIVARAAREIGGRYARRIPGSVRVSVSGDGKTAVITAGGPAAPMAYTFEGRNSGAPISHPVYGHGLRSEWTWKRQIPVHPFMKEAIDSTIDRAADTWGSEVVDQWAKAAGFR